MTRSSASYSRTIFTDENGCFDVPAIAIGPHGIRTVPRFDFGWWAQSDGLVEVGPGKTAEVVLTLKRAVRVHGVVREKGTEKPIAGVRVAATLAETGSMLTGRDGTYEGFAPPGATLIRASYIPPGYARSLFNPREVVIREDAVEVALPPFELMKAGEVPGLVIDEHARPAAGAGSGGILDHGRAANGDARASS